MDNREAFEKWYCENRNQIQADDYNGWMLICWQAATAHNTDAVIDECMNEVQKAADEFVTSVHLGFNFKFNEMVEDMMNRLRALKTSSAIKIRSLKTNKEW